jgi:hypothetical protein
MLDSEVMARRRSGLDRLPDVRDGVTRLERVILWQISAVQRELGRDQAPTAMVYGRVVEHLDLSVDEFQACLEQLVGRVPARTIRD